MKKIRSGERSLYFSRTCCGDQLPGITWKWCRYTWSNVYTCDGNCHAA